MEAACMTINPSDKGPLIQFGLTNGFVFMHMFIGLPVHERVGYCLANLNVLFSISLTSLTAVFPLTFTCVTRHKGIVNWNSDDTLKEKK